MMGSERRARGSLIVLVALALFLAACDEKKTIQTDAAEETVVNLIAEKTGFKATDMSCPEDVEAEVGATFECTFTGPEGPYVASVEVTEVDGEDAVFQVDSRRAD
jgi:hypothetical protein